MRLPSKLSWAAVALACCALCASAAGTPEEELGRTSRAHHDAWRAQMLELLDDGPSSAAAGRRLKDVNLSAIPEKRTLPTKVDVGIITAFAPEVQAVLDRMTKILGKVTYSGRAFFVGRLSGKLVAVTTSGESMVNAALTTQLFFDKFDVGKLLFSGIAGGINPANNIGDVIIPRRWAQPQQQRFIRPLQASKYFYYGSPFNTFTDDTFLKLPNGEYSSFNRPGTAQCTADLTPAELASFKKTGLVTTGFALPIVTQVLKDAMDIFQNTVPAVYFIGVDQRLFNIAVKVAATVKLSKTYTVPGTNTTYTLDKEPKIKAGGTGTSASTFVDNAEYRAALFQQFGAELCDMESSAFMQVCATNKKRCLVIRSLSDLAGGDAEGNQVFNFLMIAAYHSSIVLQAMVAQM